MDFAIVKIHFYIVISFAYLPQGSSEVEVNHWDLIQLKVIESVDVLGDKMWTLARLKKMNYPHFILANQMEIYFLFQYHSYFCSAFYLFYSFANFYVLSTTFCNLQPFFLLPI